MENKYQKLGKRMSHEFAHFATICYSKYNVALFIALRDFIYFFIYFFNNVLRGSVF